MYYEKAVTIACVNFHTCWGNKAANLQKIKSFTIQAASQGNDIVVFPELALSGYECPPDCQMHPELAETIPGPSTEEVAGLAARHNIYVIFGMPEQDKEDPSIRHISSAVIGPEGILGVYRRLHISPRPPASRPFSCFKPGKELPVFPTRFGLIGVQICYDFWLFPELSRILVLKGARIIINTSASFGGPGKPYFMVQQTGARATENRVFTASANLVGKELTVSYYGHSTIAGPAPPSFVKIYAEAGDDEEMVSTSLNLEMLENYRRLWNWEEDRRGDIILREFSKL